MKWMVSKTHLGAGWGLLALLGAALAVQAADTSVRRPLSGSRLLTNATVVGVDAEAGTLTVRGGGIGKEQTFTVAADARPDIRSLRRGDEVVLALHAAATGEEAVTRVERSPATKPSPPSPAGGDAPLTATPAPVAEPPLVMPTPAPSPRPSAVSTPRPTDIVGPFRDPRVNPHYDPRVDPHRDPRVIPGLTEPAPTPAPTTSPATGE